MQNETVKIFRADSPTGFTIINKSDMRDGDRLYGEPPIDDSPDTAVDAEAMATAILHGFEQAKSDAPATPTAPRKYTRKPK